MTEESPGASREGTAGAEDAAGSGRNNERTADAGGESDGESGTDAGGESGSEHPLDRHGVGEPPDRPARAADALRADPALAPVVEAHGPLALSPSEDPFRRLVVAITRQQVSTASARAVRRRLFEAVDPTPAAVLAADPERLEDAGLSARKAEYVRNVARAFRDGDLPRDRTAFEGVPDGEVVDALTAVTGVGEWTAAMFLLFVLGRPDVFPVGDLGVRRGAADLTGLDPTDRAALRARARRWRPYRSYAALYCWGRYEGGDADAGEP